MKVELDENRRRILSEKVQAYFSNELEEPIGKLKADLIIGFFLEELGPRIYNQAIDDAQAFMQDRIIDLEGTLYLPE